MKTTTVTTVATFIEECQVLDLFSSPVLFRGQPVKGNLLPSIARKDASKDSTDKERSALAEIRLVGASLIPEINPTDLDLLVRAQHFGLKTRLLDWTTNPLAALWFACADLAKADVYVYALEAHKYLIKDVYAQDPFLSQQTRAFQPRHTNERVNAQHGWFTLHRYSRKAGKFVPLESNPQLKADLHEFHIRGKSRPELLRALDLLGVNARTLFPDLNGLCRYINWKHNET